MREVPEWHGKTADEKVPDRVRLRIWARDNGYCHITKLRIMPGDKWELDHIVALANGGKHCESNLAPALYGPHKLKSAEDRKLQAKSDRIRKRHAGIKKRTKKIPYRKFDGTPVWPGRE